jgi:uncharacterized DUF497 family protein
MNDMIGFAWDEGKSERCLRERGFSFDFVVRLLPIPIAESRSTIAGTTASRAIGSTAGLQVACS